MKQEVEIKYIIKNPRKVQNSLDKKANFVGEVWQKDEWFSLKHKDFFNKIPAGEGIRVRHQKNKNSIAYFYFNPDVDGNIKIDEYETSVGKSHIISEIFKKLDMYVRVTVTKNRRLYNHSDFNICLDHIKELGWFIEIEAKKVDQNIPDLHHKMQGLIKEFGVDGKNLTEKGGYPDLIINKELLK